MAQGALALSRRCRITSSTLCVKLSSLTEVCLVHPLLKMRRLVRSGLEPFLDPRPAPRLIRSTARAEWPLITVNLLSNLLQALAEAATFGIIFLAVDILSKPVSQSIDLGSKGFLNKWPIITNALSSLPRTDLFLLLLGIAVLIKIAQGVAMYIGNVSLGHFTARSSAKITALIHAHVLNFTFPCASRFRVGDLLYSIGSGPSAVISEINITSGLLMSILMALTYLFVLISLSPWLLGVAILMAGFTILVQQQLLPRIRSRSFTGIELDKSLSMGMVENIQALRLLHTMGQLEEADQDIRSRMGELEGNKRAQAKLNSINAPIMTVLPILMIAALTGLSLVVFGNRSSGILPSLVTFVMALQRLNGSITSITQSLGSLNNNAAGLDILNRILESSDKEFRRKGGAPLNGLRNGIEFRDVSLSYSADLKPALSEINLKISKGQTIALVGSSGAGKSSLADMLVGLYPPSSGQLLIDGIPMDKLDLSCWQKKLGVVSQDTFLFNSSILENIRFGNPGTSLADVEAAAKKAQAHGFIKDLPMGYETVIGERGYRLSGGQRQRLSLSRAILRDPELLILDEATSALDTESEQLVQQAIDQFEGKHTVLVIAHRLSTIVNADLICVMDQGRIIEKGSHSDLINKGGRYANLWKKQSKDNSSRLLIS